MIFLLCALDHLVLLLGVSLLGFSDERKKGLSFKGPFSRSLEKSDWTGFLFLLLFFNHLALALDFFLSHPPSLGRGVPCAHPSLEL